MMELINWIKHFFLAVAAHIAAFITIVLLIFAAPLISVATVVWMLSHGVRSADLLGWFGAGVPFCCGIWYMFVASMTRLARAKRFGVTPRTGFFWAGGRLFFGWAMSQAAVLILALAFTGAPDSAFNLYVILIGVVAWSPLTVNLLRHFARRYPVKVNGTSAPCQAAA
jgi:hypothetical protein